MLICKGLHIRSYVLCKTFPDYLAYRRYHEMLDALNIGQDCLDPTDYRQQVQEATTDEKL